MIRILHVDDNHGDHLLLKQSLLALEESLEIDWTKSAKRAEEVLEAKSYDCILCDDQMPGMNGLELLENLHNRGDDTPFLFLAEQGSEQMATNAFHHKAYDYFVNDGGTGRWHRLLNSVKKSLKHRALVLALEKERIENRNREKITQSILNATTNDIAILIRADGGILQCNKTLLRLFKIGNDKLNTLNVFDILPKELIRSGKNMLSQVIKTGRPLRYDKNCGKYTFDVSLTPVICDDSKKNFHVAVFAHDITRRKEDERRLFESERFLNLVFDAIQDGISVVDKNFMVVRVNQVMRDWYSHMMPFEGQKRCFEVYHGRSEPCKDCPTVRAFKSGKLEMSEIPFIQGGRVAGMHEIYSFPIFDQSDKVTGAIENIRNITARKNVEKELRNANDRLEERVRVRTIEFENLNRMLSEEAKKRRKNALDLEESNVALKILLRQVKEDRSSFEQNILSNIKFQVEPYLNKLNKNISKEEHSTYINIIESNLRELVSSFANRVSSKSLSLSPKELLVAGLIKDGKQDKEIAGILNISLETVKTHRQNIRKKLGIYGKRTNLISALENLTD